MRFFINIIPKSEDVSRHLFFGILFSLFLLVSISLPISLVSLEDDIGVFDGYVYFFLISTLIYTIIFFSLLFIVYKVSKGKIIAFLCWIGLSTLLMSIYYAFFYFKDYGVIDNFILSNANKVNNTYFINIIDIVVFLICSIVALLTLSKIPEHCKSFLNIFIMSNLVFSIFSIYTINSKIEGLGAIPLNENKKVLKYSRNGKNIVILMLDGAMDGFIPHVIRDDPDFSSNMNGFTWYSNSVSTGNRTINTVPSLFGGYEYTVDGLNKQKGSFKDKLNQAYHLYSDNFIEKGYKVTYTDPFWYGFKFRGDCKLLEASTKASCFSIVDFLGKDYMEKFNDIDDSALTFHDVQLQYLMIALFKVIPGSFKEAVYQSGEWLGFSLKLKKKKNEYLINYFSLNNMRKISEVVDEGNTLTFVSNNITRATLALPKDCLPNRVKLTEVEDLKEFHENETVEIYHTIRCALHASQNYINWFKENKIYDNTMFVLVSDHGWKSNNPLLKLLRKDNLQKTSSQFQSLLLVKHFDEVGPLRESREFISNASVPGIICDVIGGCINKYTKNIVKYEKLLGPVLLYETPWQPNGQNHDGYLINKIYEVEKDISDPDNWRVVK